MSNGSIWPIDKTLSSASIPRQSGPGSNGNEEILRIPQGYTDWSLAIRLFNVISKILVWAVLPLCRDAVGVFYSISQLGCVCVCIYINIYIYHHHVVPPARIIPDPLSPLLPIIHPFWQVLRATSRILTELLCVGLSWSSCFCLAIWGGP